MGNEEKILSILAQMQADMSQMKQDISEIKSDIAELKEEHTITREGVNTLLGWADDVARVIKVPLKAAE